MFVSVFFPKGNSSENGLRVRSEDAGKVAL